VYFTLGSFPISELIGFGDTAYRGIGTPFQSPAQNIPPAVRQHIDKLSIRKYLILKNILKYNDMSFGGHVQEMINRMKANEDLRRSRRDKKKKIQNLYLSEDEKEHSVIREVKLSESEMKSVKDKIRNEMKKERIKEIVITSVVSVILFVVLIIILLNL
jgi:hypothetical protein